MREPSDFAIVVGVKDKEEQRKQSKQPTPNRQFADSALLMDLHVYAFSNLDDRRRVPSAFQLSRATPAGPAAGRCDVCSTRVPHLVGLRSIEMPS